MKGEEEEGLAKAVVGKIGDASVTFDTLEKEKDADSLFASSSWLPESLFPTLLLHLPLGGGDISSPFFPRHVPSQQASRLCPPPLSSESPLPPFPLPRRRKICLARRRLTASQKSSPGRKFTRRTARRGWRWRRAYCRRAFHANFVVSTASATRPDWSTADVARAHPFSSSRVCVPAAFWSVKQAGVSVTQRGERKIILPIFRERPFFPPRFPSLAFIFTFPILLDVFYERKEGPYALGASTEREETDPPAGPLGLSLFPPLRGLRPTLRRHLSRRRRVTG